MVYKIRVILDSEEDVFRDIEIKGIQTLWNLHQGIKSAFCLTDNELASFYHVDDQWKQLEEIPLEDMTDDRSGVIMADVTIKKVFPKKNSRLLYIYDFLHMWTFFVELMQIDDKKPALNYPLTINRHGKAPLKAPKKKSLKKSIMEEPDDLFIYQEAEITQIFGELEVEEPEEGYDE